MAMALGVPGNRLRLRTPSHSGGSFGAKHAVFPYVVLLALAARKAERPVKWVESRLEHLTAATSATNRVTTLSAAVEIGTASSLPSPGISWRIAAPIYAHPSRRRSTACTPI
jgi:CO/xanthine dehydrogenase Mo-binding subunit